MYGGGGGVEESKEIKMCFSFLLTFDENRRKTNAGRTCNAIYIFIFLFFLFFKSYNIMSLSVEKKKKKKKKAVRRRTQTHVSVPTFTLVSKQSNSTKSNTAVLKKNLNFA